MKSIVVENLTKEYGPHKAVDNISFSVSHGRIHGFLGPNGAGKSTTMKMMSALLPPTSGDVFIQGKRVTQFQNYIKSVIGILPEELPLYLNMRVAEYLKFVAQINRVQEKDLAVSIKRTLKQTRLEDVAHRLIGNLSRGYKQRVGVASALVFNPEIIILDEPTLGLDPASIKDMRNLILELKKNHTIILSSHLLHEVGQLCDDLTIINKGRIVTSGSYENILREFKKSNQIEIEFKDFKKEKMDDFIKKNSLVDSYEIHLDKVNLKLKTDEEVRDELIKDLVQHDFKILNFSAKKTELEEIFLEVTKNDENSL